MYEHIYSLIVSLLDFPSLKQIADNELRTVNIQNSDCSFMQEEGDCLKRYNAKGTCTLSQILSQLVPNVNMEESTKNFIVPAKFRLLNFDLSRCGGESDFVIMKGTSMESVELVPQQLTLGVGTELHLSWDFVHDFNPSKLEVKLNGQTSIGEYFECNYFCIMASDYPNILHSHI